MAIDPRIALGVQPVQPVNMLGIATQGLALQAAAEEMESSRGLKEALAGGMSATDPRVLQYGKQGRESYKVAQEARVKQLEMAEKVRKIIGSSASFVYDNPTPENFASTVESLVAQGIYTPEQAQAAFARTQNDPVKIKELAGRLRAEAIDAEKQLPKFFSQDLGGTYQIVGVNPLTGKPDVVSRTGKTLTPGQAMEQSQWAQVMGGAPVTGGAPVSGRAPVTSGAPVTGATPTGTAPARTNAMITGTEGADTTTVSESQNVLQQIADLDAEIARVSQLPGNAAAKRVDTLIARKKSLIEGEQFRTGKQESAFEQELGKVQAKDVADSRKAAQDAAEIIRTNQIGREILDSGAITGSGADFFVGLNQALKTAGIDLGYADAAANSQAYVAAMAQNTGKIIKQFGAGTGLSDADRKYAEQAAAGKITMDETAIRRILRINDEVSRNLIERHNKKVKDIKTNIPLTVEMPPKAAPSQRQQALEWAKANPTDPRSAQILQRLGEK